MDQAASRDVEKALDEAADGLIEILVAQWERTHRHRLHGTAAPNITGKHLPQPSVPSLGARELAR